MSNTYIQPMRGMVLVAPDEKPKEVGGFILAGDAQNSAPVKGKVIRAQWRSPFQVGETLYFRRYAIDDLKYINEHGVEETVFLIDEREVLGVVREPFSLRNWLTKFYE